MAGETAVEQAIYALRYDSGDSAAKLREVRLAATEAAAAGERLAVSEENVSRSTLKLLAALDPRIRAEMQAAQQLERINRLHVEGSATSQQYALAVTRIEENLKRKTEAVDFASRGMQRLSDGVGGLIGRYTSWAAIIVTVRRLVQEAIRTNEEAAASVDRMGEAYTRLAQNAGPAIVFVTDLMTGLLGVTNRVVEGLGQALDEIRRSPLLGGPGARTLGPIWAGAGLSNRLVGGNWIPGAEGFPASGVTDITPDRRAAAEALRQIERQADAIHALSQEREKMWEKNRIAQDKAHADFMKNINEEIVAISQQSFQIEHERERRAERELKEALEYGERLSEQVAAAERKRTDDFIEEQKRIIDQQQRYWSDSLNAMALDGRDFFRHFFETGEADLNDFLGIFRRAWANLLADIVQMRLLQPVMAQVLGSIGGGLGLGGAVGGIGGGLGLGGGLGGGGLLGALGLNFGRFDPTTGDWIPGAQGFPGGGLSFGGLLGGGLAGLGIGSIFGMIGGNTTGGAIGGGLGGAIGSFFGPVGSLIGGGLGGLIGGLFKGNKPSDFRSVATFGPGYDFTIGAQSAHETSQQTLSQAQAAASAISQEIQALTAFGVQFTQQLSNIWIGQRDPSTFQLVGGQRISAGTVGDVADLAADTISALLKTATSSDPEIAAILQAGGSAQAVTQALQALQAARAFSSEIEMALLQIQDPMKAAIALWQKEAQARLDMAVALGLDIDKVQQLNAALYQQMIQQLNAPAIQGLEQFIQSLQFGPGSAASPQAQYTAAFSAYDAARAVALASPTAQTAAAFQQSAQAFLPIAREYYGTTATYQSFVQGAINTAEQLKSILGTPAPFDPAPLIQTTAMIAPPIVEQLQITNKEVSGLRADVANLSSLMQAIVSRVATGV